MVRTGDDRREGIPANRLMGIQLGDGSRDGPGSLEGSGCMRRNTLGYPPWCRGGEALP